MQGYRYEPAVIDNYIEQTFSFIRKLFVNLPDDVDFNKSKITFNWADLIIFIIICAVIQWKKRRENSQRTVPEIIESFWELIINNEMEPGEVDETSMALSFPSILKSEVLAYLDRHLKETPSKISF